MRGLHGRWFCRGEGQGAHNAPLLDRILAVRGLDGSGAAETFLSPKLTHLHDPSAIPDLDRAARRLLDALAAREPIVIYGDYDVDGITASAILYHTLRAIAPDASEDAVRTYVPHRIDEGYGLNSEAIAGLADAGARVIVSVDCGVTAVEPALVARARGVDLIITDHHNGPADVAGLPPAFAVVHPRRPDSRYPFGELCGAGVAFKLAWRLATMHCGSQRVTPALRELLIDLLAFAALGVIADVVPLVDENRVIARFGLERMRTRRFAGLHALVVASGLESDKVDAMDVGFKLGPRLNACGRLGHAREAVELFTTADPARAAEIAAHLTAQNDARRTVERGIFETACERAEAAGMTGDGRRAIVLADENWHPGVVGIVCSRLVERYCRPAILMQRRDGGCHGSGRSVYGFNLHAALESCSGLLERFGGHDMAAGLHLRDDRLDAFTDAFTAEANTRLAPDDLCRRILFDCEAGLGELSPDTVARLNQLAPFGRDNPEVRVLVRGLTIGAPPQPLGAHAKHLALHLRNGTAHVRAVAWNWGEHRPALQAGVRVDAVIEPKLSRFNGRVTVEPELRDLAIIG